MRYSNFSTSAHVLRLRPRRRCSRCTCTIRTPRSRHRPKRPCRRPQQAAVGSSDGFQRWVPATDIDDGWSGWRTSGAESGRGPCVLLLCCRHVDSIVRGNQAVRVRVPTGPANVGRRHWRSTPPVAMETPHGLIIIIIQCLWAAVGSPSKREDSVGAQSGPVDECSCRSCACLDDPRPPGRIDTSLLAVQSRKVQVYKHAADFCVHQTTRETKQ